MPTTTEPSSPPVRRRALVALGALLAALAAALAVTRAGGAPAVAGDAPVVGEAAPAGAAGGAPVGAAPVGPAPAGAAAAKGGGAARADVEAAPRLARLVGRVVDEHGAPIEGVRVAVAVHLFPISRRSARTVTHADGTFRLEELIPGRAVLSFAKHGFCSISLKPEDLDIGHECDVGDVCLARGTEVAGTVRIDGQPAPGVQLWILRAADDRVRADAVAAISGRDGRFTVGEPLPPGRYRVLLMPALQLGPFAQLPQTKVVACEFDLVQGQVRHDLRVELEGRH